LPIHPIADEPRLTRMGLRNYWGYNPVNFFALESRYAAGDPVAEFRALVARFHEAGIEVILDVVFNHTGEGDELGPTFSFRGIDNASYYILRPDDRCAYANFAGTGNTLNVAHPYVRLMVLDSLRHWAKIGVDGFRLDVDIFRPDLWATIRRNAWTAGHPIVLFEEVNSVIPGVTDFSQHDEEVHDYDRKANLALLNDVPGLYDRKFGRTGHYKVRLRYEDGKTSSGSTDGDGPLRVRLNGLTVDKTSGRVGDYAPDGIPDIALTIEDVEDGPVENVTVTQSSDRGGEQWGESWSLMGRMPLGPYDRPLAIEGSSPTLQTYLQTLSYGSAVQLSCHQNDEYVAKGSRATFGYSFLLTPMIPIFMAGEEFDADFHALPNLTPRDDGEGKDPGKGTMLYGSMLTWAELDQPRHRSMLEDVKKMLSLRTQEAEVLTPILRGDIEPQLVAVPHESDINIPIPYMRWSGRTAIVVVANRNTEADAHLRLNFPLDRLGRTSRANYRLTDLWNNGTPKDYTSKALSDFAYTVRRDNTPRGGLGVIKIERIH